MERIFNWLLSIKRRLIDGTELYNQYKQIAKVDPRIGYDSYKELRKRGLPDKTSIELFKVLFN